ncbi:MAG: hypothetical protein ACI9G1_000884 [Pirellulaceae bacterium]|jgi:hypothetical protein
MPYNMRCHGENRKGIWKFRKVFRGNEHVFLSSQRPSAASALNLPPISHRHEEQPLVASPSPTRRKLGEVNAEDAKSQRTAEREMRREELRNWAYESVWLTKLKTLMHCLPTNYFRKFSGNINTKFRQTKFFLSSLRPSVPPRPLR